VHVTSLPHGPSHGAPRRFRRGMPRGPSGRGKPHPERGGSADILR